MVYEVLGGIVPERGIPLQIGAVVSNESFRYVAHALDGKPVTHRYLTVGCEVRKPMVVRVPVGIRISPSPRPQAACSCCRPTTTWCAARSWIPRSVGATNTICCQCSQCTDLCPRQLLGHSLHPHRLMRVLDGQAVDSPVAREALLCSECGICEKFACPMGLSPREVNAQLKKELMAAGVKWENRGEALAASRFRDERRIPTSRRPERAWSPCRL